MTSLTYLFSPTFLMFLGVLFLVVAVLVVYYESKMRDQNHKIASMLSLVSTLAEDMNGVKIGLHQLAVTRMGGSIPQNFEQPLETSRVPYKQETKLIEVSDDEDDVDEDDVDEDVDEDNGDEDDDEDEDEDDDEDEDEEDHEEIDIDVEYDDDDNEETNHDDEESKHDVLKVFKIDMTSDNDLDNLSENNSLELQDLDDELSEVQSLSSKSSKLSDKLEEIVYEKTIQESLNISSDFKTISINLEDEHSVSLDYKKLSLPKLRSIVSEKGLASDTSKLKKIELLKLLGGE
jgi:hypothetical protein